MNADDNVVKVVVKVADKVIVQAAVKAAIKRSIPTSIQKFASNMHLKTGLKLPKKTADSAPFLNTDLNYLV